MCCGCCQPRKGFAMFCAISFALYMLGYWNYTPDQQGASKGHTFSDYGVGHAKELCGDPMSGRYCELVCETDGQKTARWTGSTQRMDEWTN